ncbi:hypothetical protein [Acinetobacter calcoaceticus]|uniref:hypothetical protein n=1 Tax=Acinetobacter calcoaceticus TaxID=471 RepID=UPI003009287E
MSFKDYGQNQRKLNAALIIGAKVEVLPDDVDHIIGNCPTSLFGTIGGYRGPNCIEVDMANGETGVFHTHQVKAVANGSNH